MVALATRLVLASVIVGTVASARAYCRTHSDDPRGGSCPVLCPAGDASCPSPCDDDGLPFYWSDAHIEYTLHERGFAGLSALELRAIFAESFDSWASAQCETGRVGLDFDESATTTSEFEQHRPKRRNVNAIAELTEREWSELGYSRHAFAYTTVWFDGDTGEIAGADMMFNGRLGPYGTCSDQGCSGRSPAVDLANVATHEIGHLLGLAHSPVRGSTMWCRADAADVDKRDLSSDDVAGVCALFPPDRTGRKDQALMASDGCACTAVGPRSRTLAPLWFALATALLFARRGARTRFRKSGGS